MGGLTERVGIMIIMLLYGGFHLSRYRPRAFRCIYAQSGKGLNHNDYSETGKL